MDPLYIPENAVQPSEVRIEKLRVETKNDPKLIRVHVLLTPFLTPPDVNFTISDLNGETVTTTSIISTLHTNMVFTMHIRTQEVGESYSLTAEVHYPDLGPVHKNTIQFNPYGEDSQPIG